MTDVTKTVESFFLEHGAKDLASVKEYNRQYYLRNRKLKGLAPKRVEEDEVPMKSPTGAKLVDYDGKGPGKATYSDGSTFDGNGWSSPTSKLAGAKTANAAARLNAAQTKINRARLLAQKKSDPKLRAASLSRLAAVQRALNTLKKNSEAKASKKPIHTKPDKAGRPPGHPKYGDDPPAKRKEVK